MNIKKCMALLFTLACLTGVCGCRKNDAQQAQIEQVSTDYGRVIEMARAEFEDAFREFENMKIEETSTMARTDDSKEVVVQFKYSSDNGEGVYGFLYDLTDSANPELLQGGEDITIDALVN